MGKQNHIIGFYVSKSLAVLYLIFYAIFFHYKPQFDGFLRYILYGDFSILLFYVALAAIFWLFLPYKKYVSRFK